ncbi:MAG: methylenetetrahydrofolate--tRNA-(uracil(54)-C(5))-methyltransferase (FADH(2)-oxidizing) TrmFO [Coriobacteriales bacterium]|nr:methylenetetrahydrofolate--tRNA-(uracil(54)-C(5))-methyltransferase (FADH(2)-oxidizing) TrmFO [Coriobacteriales bacterium]
MRTVTIIGGGLAGSEAAWQLAERGVAVRLIEMRPSQTTAVHRSASLAELVCSNSLKSMDTSTAAGTLKQELACLGSFLLSCALKTRVEAGGALAVDREAFAAEVTRHLTAHPLIEVVREEISALDDTSISNGPLIIATGPLTSPSLEAALTTLLGSQHLSFFDAAAPIVEATTLDFERLFAQSRYDRGGADYLNAAMDRAQYEHFVSELTAAQMVVKRSFETDELFSACQPIEEVARTGLDTLRHGALKPVGLRDPRTGQRPWAVVQLRAENRARSAYNLVGFQTNLTFGEQQRVFRLIPGLEQVQFSRFGVMHRNTFIDAPRLLTRDLALQDRSLKTAEQTGLPVADQASLRPQNQTSLRSPRRPTPGTPSQTSLRSPSRASLRFAGQITGTEGYCEAIGSGLYAALATWAELLGLRPPLLPVESTLGSLLFYATDPETQGYQPMHVNYGIMAPLDPPIKGKRERYAAFSQRAQNAIARYRAENAALSFLPSYTLP